jgi:hypothetical protein
MEQTRRCKRCDKTKPLDEFSPGAWDAENKLICAEYRKNPLTEIRWCIQCQESEPIFGLPKQIEVSTLEAKGKYLERTYDISLKEYEQLFIEQFGVCAICHKPPTEDKPFLVVDHDHETGMVRGLLCNNCNIAIGLLKDNADTLRSAVRYIQASRAAYETAVRSGIEAT